MFIYDAHSYDLCITVSYIIICIISIHVLLKLLTWVIARPYPDTLPNMIPMASRGDLFLGLRDAATCHVV